MNRNNKNISGWFLGKIPLSIYNQLISRDVIGLFYHMVSAGTVAHTEHLYPHRDVDLFEQDLKFIKENYEVLSFEDLHTKRFSRSGLRKPAIFLSFDDGFSQCYSIVRPLLLKYELPCMFFITTNFIDNQQMYYRNKVSLCIDQFQSLEPGKRQEKLIEISVQLNEQVESGETFIPWIKSITADDTIDSICTILNVNTDQYLIDQKPYMTVVEIKSMSEDGFTVGAHSQRHQKLGRLSNGEIVSEIVGSCEIIQTITGKDYVPFSFPNTATGIDRNLLNQILFEHPSIGLLFDAKGLDIDRDFIYNRIWVESPKLNVGGNRPIQQVIKSAYEEYVITRFARKVRP